MFFFLIGFSIDGLNIVAPPSPRSTGIAYDQVLGVATWAGMIGVVAYILIARINVSVGPALLSGVCLIGAGLSLPFSGAQHHPDHLLVALTLVTCFISSAAYIANNTLIAQWFPKKKGLTNSFTTVGPNCGSAFLCASDFLHHRRFRLCQRRMSYVAVGAIVLGIIGLVLVRNTPRCGMYPDNVTREVYERGYFQEATARTTAAGLPVKIC